MKVTGKIIGAALGALGGPLGAVFGGLLGHLFDRTADPATASSSVGDELSNLVPPEVVRHLHGAAGLAAVAYLRNGGPAAPEHDRRRRAERVLISHLEIELGYAEHLRPYVRRIFGRFLTGDAVSVAELRSLCRATMTRDQRHKLIALLFAVADGEHRGLRPEANELIERTAMELGMPTAVYVRLRERMLGDADGSYAALGVEPTASAAEIKRAYRSLVARYHPDRVSAPEDVEAATARFRRVQRAFEAIRNARGF